MQPRYRKSSPEIKKFANEQEQHDFVRNLFEAQLKTFDEITENLKPHGFKGISHTGFSAQRTESLGKLLNKIDKFCPHFATTTPAFRHIFAPSIGVGCCYECLGGYMPLLMADSSGCDLCGVGGKKDTYVEISIPIGFGTLAINLGVGCCADIFTKQG
jgi:hypothetical protein